MTKPVIGIITQISGWNDDSVFTNRYYVLDNYVKAIVKAGGIPIAILMNDLQVIPESLELCDGFLIPGGIIIKDYHLQVIDYAIKNNKPLLGICMGMQAIAMYSLNKKVEKEVLEKIAEPNFHNDNVTKSNRDKIAHKAQIIKKESYFYKILEKEEIEVNSFHKYKVKNIGTNFEIVAKSEDGLIEVIEAKDKTNFILGTAFHPELLPSMQNLFKTFIEKSRNSK